MNTLAKLKKELAQVEKQLEKYERKYLDEDGEEIDLDNDEYLQDGDVIGYHCTGCGHVQQTTGLNWDCDKCCGCTLEEIIE